MLVSNASPENYSFTINATGEYVRVSCVHGTTDDPDGIANKTTKDVTIEDSLGRTIMSETYVCTGSSNYSRIAWTVNVLNDLGQVTDTWKSDNTLVESTWGCCGKESETDAQGLETSYSYDALKRVTIMTRQAGTNSIITQYTYDAEGRRLSETVTAGSISQTSSNQYDLAGRLVNSWDNPGRHTQRAYTDSGRTITETLPGGLTRITSRYMDGKTKSITGTAQIAQYYEYGVTDGLQWTKVYTASDDSPVWTKTYTDALGRTVKTEKPGFSGTETTENFYNNLGQLVKTTTSGQSTTLYTYDELGNQFRSGLDINDNGALDLASMDRITESETSYASYSDQWWQETVSRIYPTDDSATPLTNSVTRRRLTGLAENTIAESVSLDAFGNQTAQTTTLDRDTATVTQTADFPDSTSNAVSITVNGLLQSQSGKSGHITAFAYDALGRRTATTDPRTGTAITHYDAQGQNDWVEDAAGNRTTFTYDPDTGRRLSQTDAQTNTTYSSYTAHGLLEKTWGSATYPVSYSFDAYGRMTNMNTYRNGTGWSGSTWPESPGTADKTTWTYHEASGLLTAKTDDAGKSVAYTYSTGGKLATRTWSRADGTNTLVTTYSYSTNSGDLTGIDYSDTTPDVSFTYDRLGRQKTAESSVSAHTFSYQILNLQSEIVVRDGVTNTITRNYDTYGRATGFTLDSAYSVGYGYDTLGRFSSVSSSVDSVLSVAQYSYLPASDLLSGYTDSVSGLQVSRTYEDHRNLLTQVNNSLASTTLSQYDYANDSIGRRTSVKHSGTAFDVGPAFNAYGYNARSEVTNAARYWGSDLGITTNPVLGQDYDYAYDNIGNRTSSARGTNAMTYTANSLNQYSQRTIPEGFDVLGSAETNTTVTVNNLATTRFGKYWHKGLTVTNDSSSVYQSVSVCAVYNPPGTNDPDIVTTSTGNVFLAKTPEAFTYDSDGNLLSDGRFTYTWDAENRLIAAQTLTNLPSSVPMKRVEFAYDYMSRRVGKTVYSDLTNNYYQITNNSAFLYDGWNLISELITDNGSLITNSYTWGLDLSGSLSGAGGIGGLLSASFGGTTSTSSVLYCYDANGNVSDLIDSGSGSNVAHYSYSAFGETIVATGPLAFVNPFRFSTKYFVDELGMGDWGHRWYGPSLARFLSRDPIGDHSFLLSHIKNRPKRESDYWKKRSLQPHYLYCANKPVNNIDFLGLDNFNGPNNDVSVFPELPNGVKICNGYLAGDWFWSWVSIHTFLKVDGVGFGMFSDNHTGGGGSSGDFNSDGHVEDTDAAVYPEIDKPQPGQFYSKCSSINLSPCYYDLKIFKSCVSNFRLTGYNTGYNLVGWNCSDFVNNAVNRCKEISKARNK